MEKTPIFTGAGPAAGAPYTPAVKVGNTLYISGQLGIDPETGAPHTDFIKQVEGAIAGLSALLEAAGGSLDNVVKTTCFQGTCRNLRSSMAFTANTSRVSAQPARLLLSLHYLWEHKSRLKLSQSSTK